MTEEVLKRLISKGHITVPGLLRADGTVDPRAEHYVTHPGVLAAVEREITAEHTEVEPVTEPVIEEPEVEPVIEEPEVEPVIEEPEVEPVTEPEAETPIIEWQASVETKTYPADGSKCRVGLKLIDCDLTSTDVVLEASADEGVQIGWGSSLEEPILDLNYKACTKYLSIAAAAAGTYTITVVLTRDGQALTSTSASVTFGAA